MFERFPRAVFKYVAIGAGIAVVLAFLLQLIRRTSRPRVDELLGRFREAYIRMHCPICAHPIGRGPLRHAIWTRRGPQRAGSAGAGAPSEADEPYTCPACGTPLFERCEECGGTRHSLLPHCEHCGREKGLAVAEAG